MPRLSPIVLATLCASSVAYASINVSPMLIEQTVTAENNEIELTLANGGTTPIEVQLSTSPMQHDRKGNAISGRSEYAHDISRLIRVPEGRITIKPRKWRRVRIPVDVPKRAGGGYAFVHVTTIPDATSTAMVLASVDFRVIVELTFGAPTPKLVEIEEVIADQRQLAVAVRNQGEAHVRPTGSLELRDAAGKVVFTAPLEAQNVFPKLTRELKPATPLPADLTGSYTAVARLVTPAPRQLERAVMVRDGQLVVQQARTQ